MIFDWNNDRDRVVERISEIKTDLKIILKTKNDPFFLEWWLDHHENIVGKGGIVIFDNESTDDEVMSIYKKREGELTVVRFSGLHNRIHDSSLFPELYQSLQKSCQFYCFLDTDEFMMRTDGETWSANYKIIEFLKSNFSSGARVFNTIWLYNQIGSRNIFCCGSDPMAMNDGLLHGKPIISSDTVIHEFTNHNMQLRPEHIDGVAPYEIFILHYTRLSSHQRIRANMEKLLARGAVSASMTPEDISKMDCSKFDDPNVFFYASEITARLSNRDLFSSESEITPGAMILHEDGMVSFFGASEKDMFKSYIYSQEEGANLIRARYSPVFLA
ncbi:glycosyltransferase family 2 protein [Azospirillum sp. A1-3]|uniref:glycosyltransferase family 2 protein n=1 Tax=Azospirillum sp. A1-3 TaxID=185874 RepID=UPI0020772A7A|nr:glycosyltransferase family 2 protein [Azospirillum sp. A1-3]MCM8738909.1 glycosyltransferase family 2 protein [Azospirillum sp. A1-3]